MEKDKFDYYIKTEKNSWEIIIGLEVHAQVISNSKLFSGSSTKFGGKPKYAEQRIQYLRGFGVTK